MPPRLLVTSSTFPSSPADTATPPFVLQLCTRLADEFSVDVLAPHSPGASANEQVGRVNVLRYRYAAASQEVLTGAGGILAGVRSSRWRLLLLPLFAIGQMLALWRLLCRRQYSIVHAHWLIPQGLIAAFTLKLLRRPPLLVVTAHGADVFALNGFLARWLKRWVIRQSAAVTVVSDALRDALAAQGDEPIHVLPMGVDLNRLFVPPSKPMRQTGRILFVGRLVEKKGVATLLDALSQVLMTHPHARLWLVGAGPEEPALRRQTGDLRLDPYVRFCGPASPSELVKLYRQAEIVAFPSCVSADGDTEGLGLVPIEALGCECAVVASNLPAIRQTVVDGVTGLLAAPGDPTHLAVQIRKLLDEPELRSNLGKHGRQHVLRFDWTNAAGAYVQLFKALMGAGAT